MSGARRVALLLGCLALAGAGPARAQGPPPLARFDTVAAPEAPEDAARLPFSEAGKAFLFSAAVPGTGQLLVGSERWVPFAALEAWGWLTWLDRRGRARDLEGRYRDLAWSVARRISKGPRRDGGFEYYEALAEWPASGAFDTDTRPDVLQPETDPSTYNGNVWALARAIYLPASGNNLSPDSPEYRHAIEYYRRHAIPPEFAWSWGDNELEQEVYGELIQGSDRAYRSATRTLGLILANHLASAVDALIAARLRAAARGAAGGGGARGSAVDFDSGFVPGPEPGSWRWTAGVRLGWEPGR